MQHNKEKKSLWILPWKYPESFLIALALLLASLGLEFITEAKAPVISRPFNIVILTILVILSVTISGLSKKRPILKWFYSLPASIAAIVLFVVPSLLMALIPQRETNSMFFLYNVTSSWTYFIGVAFFLLILGSVTVKRLKKFKKKDIGFFLNHFGLWLCIASAHLGAGDIERLTMVLQEGNTTWYGYTNENKSQELDFAIKLRDFSIEEYPAKIAFVNSTTGDFIAQQNKPLIIDVSENICFNFEETEYKVAKLNMFSAPVQNRFEPVMGTGATQSVQLVKTDKNIADTFWISSPSIVYQQKTHQVDSSITMLLLKPEAKRFLSEITVYEKTKNTYDTIIEVNKPIGIAGWEIYQTSYDESMGKWSAQSNLELVKDPWLPYVYAGFFLMIAGTLYLIWTGKRKEDS